MSTEAAILDQHGECDPRPICRRIGDVPRVVAQALLDVTRDILHVLLQGEELCRAGLARRDILRADEGLRTGAFLGHAHQGILDHRQMFRFHNQAAHRLRRNFAALAAGHVFDALDGVRPQRNAVVGDHRDRLRLLRWRKGVVALPDPCRDRVAQIPFAMLLAIILA